MQRRLLGDLQQQLSLFRLCNRGYDALIVRDKPVLGIVGFAAARLARIPFCYWMSYPLPEQYLWLAGHRDGSVGLARRVWLWLHPGPKTHTRSLARPSEMYSQLATDTKHPKHSFTLDVPRYDKIWVTAQSPVRNPVVFSRPRLNMAMWLCKHP